MTDNLNKKVVKATKWSTISVVAAKLVNPVTSMVLARLLTPEAFGVVTTLNIIISFAEIITDGGFHKYIIQHEFIDENDQKLSSNVAFWSNFTLSLIIWGVIAIFSEPLAALVGSKGLGMVLIIAGISIPISAFSSIQYAQYERDLDFKTLFKVRMISIVIPFTVTVPLAILLRSYWALVLGNLTLHLTNAIMLTTFSKWKPAFFYSFQKLKEMFSFSVWSLIDAVSMWLAFYLDVFVISATLSLHYLGLYKTSTILVSQIMTLITSITTPILFSSLSRLQNDESEFRRLFFQFQKIVGMLVIPIGAGIFCFSDLLTEIMLGDQWTETAGFIGLWGLTSSFTIVLSFYTREVYRAKGRPKLSVLAQWLHIIVLLPVVLIAVKYGFHSLYVARSLIRFELILVNLIIMDLFIHLSPWQMIKNILPAVISTVPIYVIAHCVTLIDNGIGLEIMAIILCSLAYLATISLFPAERKILSIHIFNHQLFNNLRYKNS